METRKTARIRQDETDRLVLEAQLIELDVFEPNMGLEEMRQIISAMAMSSNLESDLQNYDMERALRESDIEFSINNGNVHNSTMVSFYNEIGRANYIPSEPIPIPMVKYNPATPNSSPEPSPPRTITVKADVHHSMDWEPPLPSPESTPMDVSAEEVERLKRKRLSETTQLDEITCGIMEETVQKRLRRSNSTPLLSDSGVHMSDDGGDV